MTKIKIRVSDNSSQGERINSDQLFYISNPYLEDEVIPIVREENKRKRAPRSGSRRIKQKFSFLFTDSSAEFTDGLNEDKVSDCMSSDGKEQEGAREADVHQGSRRDDLPAVLKTYTSRRSLADSMNGVQDTPQRRGSIRLKVLPSKLRESPSVLAEKQKNPQDLGHSIKSLVPVRDQPAVSEMDCSDATGISVNKLQKKNIGQQDGPASKQAVSRRDPQPPRQEIKKPLTSQVKEAQAGESDKVKITMKQARDKLPLGLKVQKVSAMQEKDHLPQGLDNNKKLNMKQIKSADYDESELETALTVIKKIMKMDAAEPFHSPVDPVALGIPDYFEVIDTPMDLGTICQTLEKGQKYRNSKDVYEDVQLVWNNCRKYNNKGDPILELLQRVKKNFMKYWAAAGLYTEKAAAESREKNTKWHVEDAQPCNNSLEAEARQHEENEEVTHGLFSIAAEKGHGIWQKQRKQKFKSQLEDDRSNASEVSEEDKIKGKSEGIAQAETISVETKQNKEELKPNSDKYINDAQYKKDPEAQSTPIKSRRVSGTGHHKFDCSCVVCTGVRRKLAREKKLATSETCDAKVDFAIQVKIAGAEKDSVNENDNQVLGDTNKCLPKLPTEEDNKGGSFEDLEDRDEVIHSEGHFAETVDAENERQEGGSVCYYHANYEIPLRKVNPSILNMGQVLFGAVAGSPWRGAHSLRSRSIRDSSVNSLTTAVTLFLDKNVTSRS